jgi:hypothetical protein
LTKTALEVFRCTEQSSGLKYLDADPSIPCFGADYDLQSKAAALFLLSYSFGIPTVLTILLYRKRASIRGDQELWIKGVGSSKEHNPHYYTRKQYGKLYQNFKPDYFYWIVVVLLRKLAIALFIAGLSNPLFAASCASLILFMFFSIHLQTLPYMEPSTYKMGNLTATSSLSTTEEEEERAKDADKVDEAEKAFRRLELPPKCCARYKVPQFHGGEGMSSKQRKFLYEIKEDMINEKPIQRDRVARCRQALAEHRYRYLQSLVLYDYNKMEKRFLQSAIFVLMAGIMFSSAEATSDSESNDFVIDILGGLVMTLVIGTTVYFVLIMTIEITKYLLLFQSVRNWAVGQFDELAGDIEDDSEHGRMMREQQKKKDGLLDRVAMSLKAWLLPEMYANERGDKSGRKDTRSASRTASLSRSHSQSSAKSPKTAKGKKKGSVEEVETPEYFQNPLHAPPPKEGSPDEEGRKESKPRGTIQPSFTDIWGAENDGGFSSGDNPMHWGDSPARTERKSKGISKGMRRSLSEGNMKDMDLESLVFSLAGGDDNGGVFQGDNPMSNPMAARAHARNSVRGGGEGKTSDGAGKKARSAQRETARKAKGKSKNATDLVPRGSVKGPKNQML